VFASRATGRHLSWHIGAGQTAYERVIVRIYGSRLPPAAHRSCQAVGAKYLPHLLNWEIGQQLVGGEVVTDQHNPLARLQLANADDHYNAMNALLPFAVWVDYTTFSWED
jgi:hypothetical protein